MPDRQHTVASFQHSSLFAHCFCANTLFLMGVIGMLVQLHTGASALYLIGGDKTGRD